MKQRKKQPNPYAIAIFTAVVAAVFSVVGGWFAAKQQIQNLLLEERLQSVFSKLYLSRHLAKLNVEKDQCQLTI